MNRFALLISVVSLTGAACGTSHSLFRGEPDTDPPGPDGDADSDSDADEDRRPDVDVPLECGDERLPIEIGPEYIVNGEERWDPAVVPLTDGQALAVGALLTRHLTGEWTNVCTATLIAPRVVLTAAHCVVDFWEGRDLDPWEVRFALGEDAASPVAVLEPVELLVHPGYDFWSDEGALHDEAALVFAEAVSLTVPEVIPIEANCGPLVDAFLGTLVQNVGYGMTDPSGSVHNTRRWWTVEEVVELTDFDFMVDGHGISGVCFGDSGGPSLWTMPDGAIRVVGTVSWGDESCVDTDHFTRTDDNCDLWDEHVHPDPCDGETLTGRCAGVVAVWCLDEEIVRDDCRARGLVCGEDGRGRMRCIEIPDPCGDETPTGRCVGDMAIWCADDAVLRRDCGASGLVCGADERGLMRCVEPDDPCRGESLAGRCDGNTAIWCEGREVIHMDCTEWGLMCGDAGGGVTRCVEPPDPCAGETLRGRCQGNVAVWCEDLRVTRQDCTSLGRVCGFDEEERSRCIPDTCRGITWIGRCLAGSAVWCHDGEIRIRRCADCGQVCGWSDTHSAYYCVDP